MKKLFFLYLITILTGVAIGQNHFWSPIKGPEGGAISSIQASAAGTLLAESDPASGSGIWLYHEDGKTWKKQDHFFQMTTSEKDPKGRIYARTNDDASSSGFLYSEDEGETWQPLRCDLKLQYVTPSPDGALYAGTDSLILRTLDDGANWSIIHQISDSWSHRLSVGHQGQLSIFDNQREIHLSVDQGSSWSVFLLQETYPGVKGPYFDQNGSLFFLAGYSDQRLYRTVDNGVNWVKLEVPYRLGDVHISPNGVLYGNSGEGNFQSSDQGETWQKMRLPEGHEEGASTFFFRENDYFLVNYHSILRSPDEGKSWEVSGDLHPNYNVQYVDRAGLLYASVYDAGIYRSSDHGNSWELFSNGLRNVHFTQLSVDQDQNIYATKQDGGVLIRSNNSKKWSIWDTLDIRSIQISKDGTLYVLTKGDFQTRKMIYSADKGESWNELQLPENTILSSFLVDANGNVNIIWFEGTPYSQERIYRTKDHGIHWELLEPAVSDGDYVFINNFFEARNGNYLLSTYGTHDWSNTVYLSEDKGITWNELQVSGNQFSQNTAGRLFISDKWSVPFMVGSSLHYSDDDGLTWTAIEENIESWGGQVSEFFLDHHGGIYAFRGDSLQYSNDSAQSWETLSIDFVNSQRRTFSIFPDGSMYLLGLDNSIHFGSLSDRPLSSGPKPIEEIELASYPNPFTAYTTIVYGTNNPTSVDVSILDLNGKQIKHLFAGTNNSGTHKLVWNRDDAQGRRVADGLYLLKLQIGDQVKIQRLLVK